MTCVAAWCEPDGSVPFANAGHLAPYRDGQEAGMPTGLPLGVAAEAEGAAERLRLLPCEAVVFLTDGVVEAAKA